MSKLILMAWLSVAITCSSVSAQTATWKGGDDRTVTLDSLEFSESDDQGYSFWVWVKLQGQDPNFPCIASTKTWEQGEVIDLLSSRNMGFTLQTGSGLGWTIAIQPNGAWTWNIGDGDKQRLDYIPTAERQRVTDDHGISWLLPSTNPKRSRGFFSMVRTLRSTRSTGSSQERLVRILLLVQTEKRIFPIARSRVKSRERRPPIGSFLTRKFSSFISSVFLTHS